MSVWQAWMNLGLRHVFLLGFWICRVDFAFFKTRNMTHCSVYIVLSGLCLIYFGFRLRSVI